MTSDDAKNKILKKDLVSNNINQKTNYLDEDLSAHSPKKLDRIRKYGKIN